MVKGLIARLLLSALCLQPLMAEANLNTDRANYSAAREALRKGDFDVLLGIKYVTDGGVAEVGFMVDDIAITGSDVYGAEADTGWTFDGLATSTGTEGGSYWEVGVPEVSARSEVVAARADVDAGKTGQRVGW